jgi:CheY-like chemotaxis protein
MPREVVLVVDDYADSRVTVRELLEEHGYQVAEAANGQEALDFLVAGVPRVKLIVLDLQMPVMSGWQFLRVLDSYVRLSAIPVLVVSAHHVRNEEMRSTIVGFLKVPYRTEQLMALVDDCCGTAPPKKVLLAFRARHRMPMPSTPDLDAASSAASDVEQK